MLQPSTWAEALSQLTAPEDMIMEGKGALGLVLEGCCQIALQSGSGEPGSGDPVCFSPGLPPTEWPCPAGVALSATVKLASQEF